MPTQEVAGAARPAKLLCPNGRRSQTVLLDGGGPDSWVDGRVIFSDTPCATLDVFASGWGRWRCGAAVRWRWGSPLRQWQDFLDGAPARLPATADRGVAGILTVLSYDLKHWIERLPRRHPWPGGPVLYSALYDWQYSANYRTGRALIGTQSSQELERRVRWYEAAMARHGERPGGAPCGIRPQPVQRKEAYLQMIRRAREYIAAGDIYQGNLAQGFSIANRPVDGAALFAEWCGRYPMPFAAYVDGGEWIAVSNSPECFLSVDGSQVATFPIKGTRRLVPGIDAGKVAEALGGDPKERAEHVMIVDLERNDLGRVCTTGSVEVAELAAVRRYPLLLHMVSEVRGRLRPETTLGALLRATFPGGSITGAPKIRAMEIIEDLEPEARGLYTGSIGWTDLTGRSRFNLAIRTAVLGSAGLMYHAGGGIVADSDPEREYEETVLKSETLFRSLATLGGRG